MKFIAIVLVLVLGTMCCAQLEVTDYQRAAQEYLKTFDDYRVQEQQIIDTQIDIEKAKRLGVEPGQYQAQLDQTKSALMYDLFDHAAGLYNMWHENHLAGHSAAPAEYQYSAVMIDSCYFRYVLHLIGKWEALSGKTYKGTPPSLEVKKNGQWNLEEASRYRNRAQSALSVPQDEHISEPSNTQSPGSEAVKAPDVADANEARAEAELQKIMGVRMKTLRMSALKNFVDMPEFANTKANMKAREELGETASTEVGVRRSDGVTSNIPAPARLDSISITRQSGGATCTFVYAKIACDNASAAENINHAIAAEIVGHAELVAKGVSPKKWAEQWLSDADTSQHSPGFEYTINTTVIRNESGILTTERDASEFTGGAHDNYSVGYSNYSLGSGRKLQLSDLLVADFMPALTELGEMCFRNQQSVAADQSLSSAGFDFEGGTFRLTNNFAIQRDGLLFLYQPYEIGSFGQGTPSFTIPYLLLRDRNLINPSGPLAFTLISDTSSAEDGTH